jgi:hypothetical protein
MASKIHAHLHSLLAEATNFSVTVTANPTSPEGHAAVIAPFACLDTGLCKLCVH